MLDWLQKWYKSNCDGDWEHCYGIKIDTLDNPGWKVDIELLDTPLEGKIFTEVKIFDEDDESNWIICRIKNNIFEGRGDSEKLETIFKIFKDWANIDFE